MIPKGLYLWCAASRKTWGDEPLGYPLKPEIAAKLWKAASSESVALPFLKDTALTWLAKRGGDWAHPPLGDSLAPDERKKLAKQYLSILPDCKSDKELHAVTWMVVDLQEPDDTMILDWYGNRSRPMNQLFVVG